MMTMHNPMHPGEFIAEVYLDEYRISARVLAEKLDVAASTLSRILKGTTRVSAEMSLRLSKTLGRSPESWLQMQQNYDLWHARRKLNLKRVTKLKLKTA